MRAPAPNSVEPRDGSRRLVLVGWDGADWRLIRPLLDAGRLPHLARLMAAGVHGPLESQPPFLPAATWTSATTGAPAVVHDILTDMEPDGAGGVRPVASTSRKRLAVWNMLSRQGRRCVVVGFPATNPAEEIAGAVASDRFCEPSEALEQLWPVDETAVWPRRLHAELAALRVAPQELTIDELAAFVEQPDGEGPGEGRVAHLAALLAQNSTTHNVATHLMEREPWDFFAVRYRFLASACHGFARYLPPVADHIMPAEAARFCRVVHTAYELQDMMLGRLVALAGEGAAVIVASNHGYEQSPRVITPLPWENNEDRWAAMPLKMRRRFLPFDPWRRHDAPGVLAMSGGGFRRGAKIEGATLGDLAPTILTLLGCPPAEDLPGRPLTAAMVEDERSVQQAIPSYEPPQAADGVWPAGYEADPWATQEVINVLWAVGAGEPDLQAAAAIAHVELRRLLHRGQALFAQGCYDDAHAVFAELAERDDALYVHVHLTETFLALKRWQDAEKRLATMEVIAPGAVVVWALRARWLAAQGRAAEAVDLLKRAQLAAPQMAQIPLHLGLTYLGLRQFEDARDHLLAALRMGAGGAVAQAALASCFDRLGERPLAEHYRRLCTQREARVVEPATG